MMGDVPAPVTVWAVDVGPASPLEEIKGSLSLTSDALVFTPRDEARPERRIALAEIAKARRLRGSPVLIVVRGTVGEPAADRVLLRPAATAGATGHAGPPDAVRGGPEHERKVRRQNVSYLGLWNKEKKALLREWERQVRRAVSAAR